MLALLLAGLFWATAVTPGTSSAYIARITNNTDTAATAANFTCTGAYGVDKANALFQYPLTEASNSTSATDISGKAANGTYQGLMIANSTTPIACPRDPGRSYLLNGSTSYLTTPTQVTSPGTFTLETWFKTSVASGKIVGFESGQTGTASGQYDRQVYLSPTGQVIFGTYNGGVQVVTSPAGYANGAWHHMIATFSAGTGLNLYLDGSLAASNTTYTTAEPHAGYWRFGQGNLNGWPNAGANTFLTGTLRFAAVYSIVFTQAQINNHYAAGR
ncbi:LamG domain-containing protein [Subtercola boreus]|uniref:LamG domain-containing protein n=1 Tax=Subtercola boreus TaxID=120213 RepID=UPI00209C3755|nr:LamG domain-containing protein [Subtercola boreus]